MMTGYVHEAPEFGYAEAPDSYGEVAYDGYGNPVGFLLPRLLNLFRGRPAPMPVPPPMPAPEMPMDTGTGEFFTPPGLSVRFTPPTWSPILRSFVRSIFSPTQNRWIQVRVPPPGGGAPYSRPWPLGWQRASLPYTGLGPNRLYMRCAVWPGPSGLVPIAPGQAPGAPGAPGGGRRRRRRRR